MPSVTSWEPTAPNLHFDTSTGTARTSDGQVANLVTATPTGQAPGVVVNGVTYGVGGGGAFNFNRVNLRKTLARLQVAKYGGATFTFGAIGDSTQGGSNNVNPQNFSVLRLAVDELVRRGYVRNGTSAGFYKESSADSRLTLVNFDTISRGSCLMYAKAAGATATFVSDVAGTIVRVWYGNTGANFTVAIDGGAAVLVTASGASSIAKYEVTGLASANHTVVVTASAINSQPYVIEVLAATTGGVHELNLSVGGSYASDYNSDQYFINTNAHVSLGVDTFLYGAGYNDVFNASATVLADDLANIDRLTGQGKEVIVFLVNPSTAKQAAVSAFNAAYAPALLTRNLPWIDSSVLFGTQAQGLADGYYSDDVHQYPPGYARQAQTLVNALLAL